MRPYVYLIFHKNTKTFYIGSKISKKANPETFFKDYFTSSKIVKSLLEKYGKNSFKTLWIKEFLDYKEAALFEYNFLCKFNCRHNSIWLNQSIVKNSKHRPEVIEKIRLSNIGRKKTIEQIEKTARCHRGSKRSEETRQRISLATKGKKKKNTEDTIENLRKRIILYNKKRDNPNKGKCWINDGTKSTMITKDKLEDYLMKGYFKGRIEMMGSKNPNKK